MEREFPPRSGRAREGFRALLLLTLLSPTLASAAGQGARVVAVVPEGGGRARAQLEVTDPALEKDFAAGLSVDRLRAAVSVGGAHAMSVRRVVGSGDKLETILAFDQSGSFARFWSEAFSLARDVYAPALDREKARQARVVTFGLRTDSSAVVQGGAALTSLLAATQATKPNQKATRLKAAILDAARLASTDVPLASGGLREVVVFTDGGEESDAYDVAELVKQLGELGVRVHVVCFYRGAPGQGRLAARLDQMKRLAEGSGGTYLQVDDHAAAKSTLDRVASSVGNLYWVDLGFCGVPGTRPTFEDHLSLEVLTHGVRTAWTDEAAFTQHAEGDALRDCTSAAAATAATTKPLAQAQTQAPTSPALPLPPPSLPSASSALPPVMPSLPVEESRFPWWWLFLGLLAVIAAIVLLRRRGDEPVVQPAPVPPPAPKPVETAAALPPVEVPAQVARPAAAWADPFVSLPETRLVVRRGPAGLEPAYRINKREFMVGGASGPEVDLVVAIPQVSGQHAMFQLYPTGAVFVTDQRSTNGTFVDGRQLAAGERVQLQPGQVVQLSRQLELELEQSGQLAPTPMATPLAGVDASAQESEGRKVKAKTIYSPLSGRDKE